MLKHIFYKYNEDYNYEKISSLYPHGFIDTKVIYPASFCYQGLQNYKYFLELFGKLPNIKNDIEKSLIEAIKISNNELMIIPYKGFI